MTTLSFDALAGTELRWRFCHSGQDRIDLQRFFIHDRAGVAYAVCWACRNPPKSVIFDLGSDDGVKLWRNRKLIFSNQINREATAFPRAASTYPDRA